WRKSWPANASPVRRRSAWLASRLLRRAHWTRSSSLGRGGVRHFDRVNRQRSRVLEAVLPQAQGELRPGDAQLSRRLYLVPIGVPHYAFDRAALELFEIGAIAFRNRRGQ